MEKVEYWIIQTEDEKYLDFNQTGDRDLDVYEVDSLDAFGFETKEEAEREINNIINQTGHWTYFGTFSKPVKAVKLTIQYKVEE